MCFLVSSRTIADELGWQIRDAAGDALTGLIPPMEVAQVCTDLLKGIESSSENEVSLTAHLHLYTGSRKSISAPRSPRPSPSTSGGFGPARVERPDLS